MSKLLVVMVSMVLDANRGVSWIKRTFGSDTEKLTSENSPRPVHFKTLRLLSLSRWIARRARIPWPCGAVKFIRKVGSKVREYLLYLYLKVGEVFKLFYKVTLGKKKSRKGRQVSPCPASDQSDQPPHEKQSKRVKGTRPILIY